MASGEPVTPPVSAPSCAPSARRRARRERRWWSRPDGTVSGSVSGGCVEGAVYELATDVVRDRRAPARAVRGQRRRRLRGRADLRRHPRHLRRTGVAAAPFPSSTRSPTTSPSTGRSRSPRSIAHPDPAVGGPPARRRTGHRRPVRSARRAPTTPSPTTPVACWPRAAARCSPTAPTGSAAARAWRCSSPAMRRARECWCSAPSTSPPRSPGRARCSATGSPCATPAPCSRRARGSRPPTRSSSNGRTATWPPRQEAGEIDGRTVICVLTHDPKFDVPLLEVALRLPEVGYVGAMGSRRTHDDRLARLREAGLTDAELSRLPARSGSTSARAPRRRRRCRSPPRSSPVAGAAAGRPLTEIDGRIHHDDAGRGVKRSLNSLLTGLRHGRHWAPTPTM